MKNHPMQPLLVDRDNVIRFTPNALVCALLDKCDEIGAGINELRRAFPVEYHAEDWRQFCQLIGYSASGYAGLSFVDADTAAAVDAAAEAIGWEPL